MTDGQSDITPTTFPELSWDPGHAEQSLDALAAWVERQAVMAIEWYLRGKRPKARASRILRILAILLTAVGAAVPFLSALEDSIALEWGYMAFAAAAACVAFDRFFGISSAWMRYLTSELVVQRLLQQLQLNRATLRAARQGQAPDPAQVAAELDLLTRSAAAILAEVERETLGWVAEFQTHMSELRALAASPQASQPAPP